MRPVFPFRSLGERVFGAVQHDRLHVREVKGAGEDVDDGFRVIARVRAEAQRIQSLVDADVRAICASRMTSSEPPFILTAMR